MATLDELKVALRQKFASTASSLTQPLSESQYDAGFDILRRGSTTYRDFIIPQLSQLIVSLLRSRVGISVLEIGPGPNSVLGSLPGCLRQRITSYVAFEPNKLFAAKLEESLQPTSRIESQLQGLHSLPDILKVPFDVDSNGGNDTVAGDGEKFDLVLFCHSMYGLKPRSRFIEQGLSLLVDGPLGGMMVVFHHGEALHLEGLVCHRTACLPTGTIQIADDNEVLDGFASFIAGVVMQDQDTGMAVKSAWREVCRELGRRKQSSPGQLFFSSPDIMAAFTRHATTLQRLAAQVPVVSGEVNVKNREARVHDPASIIRPTKIQHVQKCVRWALDHQLNLTVVGGGHGGQCLIPNVVAIDMSVFNQIHILTTDQEETSSSNPSTLVVVEAGCKTGDIIRKTMEAGLTVPLGSRPSVGAGLWLQGGIGHLARLHGLTCDNIVGAVIVSVATGEVLCIGNVPSKHQPVNAIRPENETEMLWAIRGAGSNFGIVISVTFKGHPAPLYSIQNWVIPLSDNVAAQLKLHDLNAPIVKGLPRDCCADMYFYWNKDQFCLGVTMLESCTTDQPLQTAVSLDTILGPAQTSKTADGVGLFETEMYMSEMHDGHAGGKTSSFKRCVFLKHIGSASVVNILVAAIETRPSPLCYLHLLHGGGAVRVADDATAFGCRDWEYACVITGVWPRDLDGTTLARDAVQWVYNVATDLLPLSNGAYGADLGPDPRDATLARKAFGPNLSRLARLKRTLDPSNVLAYACPLPKAPAVQKVIFVVTGGSGAGKDYCAEIWVSILADRGIRARVVSISDMTKREYASATGADFERLLLDRQYKEQHRPALKKYFQKQKQLRPQLPEDHLLWVVRDAVDVDVVLITGMRDEAPVATFSHLVPDSKLVEVYVEASKETRDARRGCQGNDEEEFTRSQNSASRPTMVFENDIAGGEAAKRFCEDHLLSFFDKDLQRLAEMVRPVANFPSPCIEFRNVLGISQQPSGLALCTSLLQSHFTGDWSKIDAIACCESGGFIFASALAAQVDVPVALIREAGKLPPPTIAVAKSASHISASESRDSREKKIEIGDDVIRNAASVVVVDDTLATGKTLCAVLELLSKAGISAVDVHVLVVAEFPLHRGRELLRQRGFGGVGIQSLLVFDGL